jgi:hypothetical protein
MANHDVDVLETPACPRLGLAADRWTHFTFPHPDHRCHATQHPRVIEPGRQPALCLTDAFPTCSAYQAWARRVGSGQASEPSRRGDASQNARTPTAATGRPVGWRRAAPQDAIDDAPTGGR